jgi:hypothetical protein
MLLIIGENEKLKTNMFDVINAKEVSIFNLAMGGLGRLVIYTENGIKDIEKRLNNKTEDKENKK